MQLPLTCSECGHQEWGSTDRPLMNKIKVLNHATKEHPSQVARVLKYSLPAIERAERTHSPLVSPVHGRFQYSEYR